MSRRFIYAPGPSRIIFGNGAFADLPSILQQEGYQRALVLSTPRRIAEAQHLADRLGTLGAGIFSGAAMHTPVAITAQALEVVERLQADCVIGLGGGSTVGLGKAISNRTGVPQIAIPTTYAGSEVTPVLGQTENGLKTTIRNPAVQPIIVIYDPELTLGLPVGTSVTSGLNAMAHAVEGLYAVDRNPVSTIMALEGCRALISAMPRIVEEPSSLPAREDALLGAWLCGMVLGQVSMSLHHKICHTLGGSFEMPHAQTHSVMLPHTAGFNAVAVPELMQPLENMLGAATGPGLYDLASSVGAPLSLRELGFAVGDLDKAAEIATRAPYPNPRRFDRNDIRALLQQAWEGARPGA